MHDSTFNAADVLIDQFSQKTISENPNYVHVNNIIDYNVIDYRKNQRIDSNQNENFDDLVIGDAPIDLGKAKFEIPNIKTSFTIDVKNYSSVTYAWTGYVTSIQDKTFIARVEDVKSTNKAYEEAEFDINDLDEDDFKLLQIGSVFYWSIGYEFRNGTKKKESFIRFKRLPHLSQKQIDDALDLSNDLFNNINWVD